jgi:hypothetical protein
MEESQALISVFDFISRMRPILPSILNKCLSGMLRGNLLDDAHKEANNAMLRHVALFIDLGGIDERFARWIVFENRISHLQIPKAG